MSTPFLDNDFDNINLYARIVFPDEIEVSDFGYTLYNLESLGIKINKRSKTAWRIYEQTINNFGVSQKNGILFIKAPVNKFPIAKNRLLQAILRINDIAYLNKNNFKEVFNDLLSNFFKEHNILFTSNIEIATGSGTSSYFDFSIPNSSGVERLVKTSARPNDSASAKVFNYDVIATAPIRDKAVFYYVVNDVDRKKRVSKETIETATRGLSTNLAGVISYSDVLKDNNILVNN
ncbi:MAG: DUF1828 domain-containing protein [Limosilactobacillus gorillae]|nr:DUF1828 domain-containing protein [Limosilactobacillus gorillae]MDO4855394.1 DUF1828 domain-containing protein [Limosilactobacillus gorillae]